MKTYATQDIRNVGLIGHKAAGKTSAAEAALWSAKATNRLGSTSDKTSILDFEEEEQKRVMSVSTSLASLEWKGKKINLLDTPGDGNFLKDTRVCMMAMDAAVCVVSAKDGVEPMHERVMSWLVADDLTRAIFISKLDVENSDFDKTFEDIKQHLCREATALQIPIGSESNFSGVVDLLREKAYIFKSGDTGDVDEVDIPDEVKDRAEEARTALIEDVAAADESLMEKYFEGTLTPEEITAGLQSAMKEGLIVPVLCGAGAKNQGIKQLLDFVVDTFPDPSQRDAWPGTKGDEAEDRAPDANGPISAVVFKTIVDQHAGRISVMRLLSGTIDGNIELKNGKRRSSERLGALQRVVGKKVEALEKANLGDLIAAVKLKDTQTFDTLSADGWVAKTVDLAAPLVSRAIVAKEKGAEDKISSALQRLVGEDPGLVVGRDDRTGQLLMSGSGLQHIEVAVERMNRKYGASCQLELPRIPYQETISNAVKGVEGKHKKQSGGSGQYGVCYFDIEPGARGTGFDFVDNIVGGSIPRQFIPSVEKGMNKTMARGIVAGYPIVDLRVRLYDGKHHAVDSSDTAFQIAGSKGLKAAFAKARPILLEPIVNMDITVPEANMGDVMGDVNTRRGRVMGSESHGKYCTVKAQMPLAEVQTYETTLRAITQGRGSFTMEHSHMDPVPGNLQDKIVKDSGFDAGDDDD